MRVLKGIVIFVFLPFFCIEYSIRVILYFPCEYLFKDNEFEILYESYFEWLLEKTFDKLKLN